MMTGMGSKYDALGKFLAAQTADRVQLSFDQIERIIHDSLPPSAGKHAVWWSNSRVDGRYNEVWLDRGWETADLNMRARTVGFVRTGLPRRSLRDSIAQEVTAYRAAPQPLETAPVAATHDIRILFEWQMLGAVVIDQGLRLSFPSVAAEPGLYRLRIDGGAVPQVYIGESDNLQRRFQNYRIPGPTQQTSFRINQLLREKLSAGCRVSIDIITGDISMIINSVEARESLRSKAVRRMVEHAALVASGGTDVELANR